MGSLLETTKPGITRLVTITALVGFVVRASQRAWEPRELIIAGVGCAVGTALSAAGANSINQFAERGRDAVMQRTAKRPLPSGRLSPSTVLGLGVAAGITGVGLLWATVGVAAALLSLACILVYVLLYTPLKPRTPIATFIGTIPGALPPLIGWAAAAAKPGFDSLAEVGGWSLFALMTVWQIPHFFALAWMYKDDYAKGGYRVLPTLERGEDRTVFTILFWSMFLVPATLAPGFVMPSLGAPYVAVAMITGVGFLFLVFTMLTSKTRKDAKGVFLASIVHLPILLVAMVVISLWRVISRG